MDERELIALFGGSDEAWDACVRIAKKMKGMRKTGARGADLFGDSVRVLMGAGGLDWATGERLLQGDLGRTMLAVGRIARTKRERMKAWLL